MAGARGEAGVGPGAVGLVDPQCLCGSRSSDLGPGLPALSPVVLHFGLTLEKVLKYKACGSLTEILMLLVCGITWALEGFVCLFLFIVIK